MLYEANLKPPHEEDEVNYGSCWKYWSELGMAKVTSRVTHTMSWRKHWQHVAFLVQTFLRMLHGHMLPLRQISWFS